MLQKGEVGSHALNSHGNTIVDREKSWKNYGIVFSNFCGNPVTLAVCLKGLHRQHKPRSEENVQFQTLAVYLKGLDRQDRPRSDSADPYQTDSDQGLPCLLIC